MFLETFFLYIGLALIVYIVNIIPLFMPPTWLMLAFFSIHYHLYTIPVIIIGAISATFGRVTLYWLTKKYFYRFLSKKDKENLSVIGKYINTKQKISIPLMLLYAFLPIPSNQVYIAAALANVNIRLLACSFFIGRLISYSFWVTLSHYAFTNINSIFVRHATKTNTLIVELIGFLLLVVFIKFDWKKLLLKHVEKHMN